MPRSFRHWLSLYPRTGIRPHGGWRKLCAYIATRARGTTAATRLSGAGCSSPMVRGRALADAAILPTRRRVSSSTAHGVSIYATVDPGVSGQLQRLADFANGSH